MPTTPGTRAASHRTTHLRVNRASRPRPPTATCPPSTATSKSSVQQQHRAEEDLLADLVLDLRVGAVERPHEVGARHDPDELSARDDREAVDRVEAMSRATSSICGAGRTVTGRARHRVAGRLRLQLVELAVEPAQDPVSRAATPPRLPLPSGGCRLPRRRRSPCRQGRRPAHPRFDARREARRHLSAAVDGATVTTSRVIIASISWPNNRPGGRSLPHRGGHRFGRGEVRTDVSAARAGRLRSPRRRSPPAGARRTPARGAPRPRSPSRRRERARPAMTLWRAIPRERCADLQSIDARGRPDRARPPRRRYRRRRSLPAAPIAIPTSASARAGASLTPSPTITTGRRLGVGAQRANDLELVLRRLLGVDAVDPERGPDRVGDGRAVAGRRSQRAESPLRAASRRAGGRPRARGRP